jgi:hypothetical protein
MKNLETSEQPVEEKEQTTPEKKKKDRQLRGGLSW